ncbi:glutamate racemase [Paenibacillus mesophilus]|uniref:glutamate racemase n=1 Tax=Paenibacillus mesophilus TaxID=2582849 RepID=UPI00110E4B7E|nr:glutamate racemase [Paenibacillus mesophilus]TMV50183.1 glutamate racemase [Paenibacillus mesophilus]
MRIVFFDSGVGGLTVMRDACRKLPSESYLYYADTLNVPYGTHSKEEVYGFVADCIDDILSRYEVRAIIIACNTATSVAVDDLRKRYSFPIIGMEPAVKPALQVVRESGRRVLATATPLTLKEDKFRRLLGKLEEPSRVDTLGLPGLVRFAEDGTFDGPEVREYLREQFAPFDLERYGAIVLGCTHFVFFKDAIRELIPVHMLVMDGNAGTVKQMMRVLELEESSGQVSEPDIVYMSSLGTEEDKRKLESCFRRLP